MKLYEFEGAELFRKESIPVPDSALAISPEEAQEKAKAIGLPVVIKAQVLTGGRYLAGGVEPAETLDEVLGVTRKILGSSIRGLPVRCVLVAPKIAATREFYLGITLDDYNGTPLAIISTEGGVSINKTARDHAETVVSRPVSISKGLDIDEAIEMCHKVGLRAHNAAGVAEALAALYRVFRKNDAILAEINPLVRTKGGSFMALDAKVEIDDSALYRQPELNVNRNQEDRTPNELERKGREIGVSYLELDGDIAIIASGAGLGMASMDIINRKMRAANFLETGGGITADLLYKVTDLVLQKKGIRALFINIYGGINPIHEGARGVVKYLEEHSITMPVVARALGNHQEETWQVFREHGVHVSQSVSTEEAVADLARILEEAA